MPDVIDATEAFLRSTQRVVAVGWGWGAVHLVPGTTAAVSGFELRVCVNGGSRLLDDDLVSFLNWIAMPGHSQFTSIQEVANLFATL